MGILKNKTSFVVVILSVFLIYYLQSGTGQDAGFETNYFPNNFNYNNQLQPQQQLKISHRDSSYGTPGLDSFNNYPSNSYGSNNGDYDDDDEDNNDLLGAGGGASTQALCLAKIIGSKIKKAKLLKKIKKLKKIIKILKVLPLLLPILLPLLLPLLLPILLIPLIIAVALFLLKPVVVVPLRDQAGGPGGLIGKSLNTQIDEIDEKIRNILQRDQCIQKISCQLQYDLENTTNDQDKNIIKSKMDTIKRFGQSMGFYFDLNMKPPQDQDSCDQYKCKDFKKLVNLM